MKPKLVFDEYCMKKIHSSLTDEPITVHTKDFNMAVFYMPLQDPEDPPEKGMYGGDSVSVYELEDGRTFFMLRNGVGHGKTGREAIKEGNRILEKLINQKSQTLDYFSRLDLLALNLNQGIIKKENSFNYAMALAFATNELNKLNYTYRGDCKLFLFNKQGEIINNDDSINYPVGWFTSENQDQDNKYVLKNISFLAGDKLICVSDGVLYAGIGEDPIKKGFGEIELTEFIKLNSRLFPDVFIKKMNAAVSHYMQSQELRDDYTIIVAEKNNKL